MIHQFRPGDVTLELHLADEHHVGEMINRWSHVHVSDDGAREVGFSDFSGDMSMPASRGYFGMLVIIQGSGELHSDGRMMHFETGDVFLYDGDVGAQRIVSKGCRYVYFTHWDSPGARAAVYDE